MKRQKNYKFSPALIAIITIALLSAASGKTIYVDDDAAGANDGTSWANAYNFLQDALADANDSNKPVEIRVAQGVYTPDKGGGEFSGDIYTTFNLINGVTLSGGYAGAADPNAHDFELYETILSGDLLGDDTAVADPCDLFGEASRIDNTYNVVTASNTDQTATLDSFTITAGIANEDYFNDKQQRFGGGMYNDQGEPVIANCTFTLNAAWDGAGMYNINSSPTLINCRFETNSAISDEYGYGGSGGGLLNLAGSPVLTNCTFIGNHSTSGGGMINFLNSKPTLTDCLFIGNSAEDKGGGMNNNFSSSPILTNCSFEANSASSGGGMYNIDNSMPILTGCTFTENRTKLDGGGMSNVDSEPNLTNCTFNGNTAIAEGGGMYNDNCINTVITNCTFTGNAAQNGGGMQNWNSNPKLSNCSFTGNAARDGGAMQNWHSNLTLTNCFFTGNSNAPVSSVEDRNGGVIENYSSNLTLTNCTLSGNSATSSPGDILNITDDLLSNKISIENTPIPPLVPEDDAPDVNLSPSHVEYINCIIWDGENVIWNNDGSTMVINYSNIRGGYDGVENINEDPLFANPGYWDPNGTPDDPNDDFWMDGDYHLKSEAGRWDPNSQSWVVDEETSPCIDAGDPDSPFGDEPMPNGDKINMGAYGGTPEASMSPEQPESSPLVAHWKLNETEGDTAYDSAGNHDAAVHGGTWTDGRIDGALLLDGFNDSIDCGDSELLRPEKMTLSLWLEPQHMGGMRYVVSRANPSTDELDYAVMRHIAGEIELAVGQPGTNPLSIMSQPATELSEWSHVAICLDGSQASIYINGQLDSAANYIAAEPGLGQNLVIGSYQANTRFYHGKMDDIRIHNKALSPGEIAALAQ